MIGTIDIKCNAAHPNMPVPPVFSFIGSPSSFRIIDVPKKIGNWKITDVSVQLEYPDGHILVKSCVLVGGAYVATVEGSSSLGKTQNGFTIFASGTDENGGQVNDYILGVGDVVVLDADGKIDDQGKVIRVRFCEEVPEEPKDGDLIQDEGLFKLYFDGEWISDGDYINDVVSSAISSAVPTLVSQLSNDMDYQTGEQLSAYAAEKEGVAQNFSEVAKTLSAVGEGLSALSSLAFVTHKTKTSIETIYLADRAENNIPEYQGQKVKVPGSLGEDRCRRFSCNISGTYESGINWYVENYVFDEDDDDPLVSQLQDGASYRFDFREIDDGRWYIKRIKLSDGTYISPHDEIDVVLAGHDGWKKAVVTNLNSGTTYVTIDGIEFTTGDIVRLHAGYKAPLSAIGNGTFSYSGRLESVDIYDDLGSRFDDSNGMFRGCTNLRSVTLRGQTTPESYTAFRLCRDCVSLSSACLEEAVNLPQSFLHCTSLLSVELPKAETLEDTFEGCSSLQSIDLPAAKTLQQGVFYGCSSLTSVSLPAAEYVDMYSFSRTALTAIECPSVVSARGSYDNNKDVFLPNLKKLSLPALKDAFFLGTGNVGGQLFVDWAPAIEEINLDSATRVNNAFLSGCQALRSFSANSLTGGVNPQDCVSLSSLQLSSATTFPWVRNCVSLKELDVPEVTAIANAEYISGCGLTSLSADKATTGTAQLYALSSLQNLRLKSMKGIVGQHLNLIPGLKHCYVENDSFFSHSLSAADDYITTTTYGGNRLTWLQRDITDFADNSISNIQTFACFMCDKLSSFDCPQVTVLGARAFVGCSSLLQIDFPNYSGSFNSTEGFKDCTALKSVRLGGEVTTTAANAFAGCSSLSSFEVGTKTRSSTFFRTGMFADCPAFKELRLPAAEGVLPTQTDLFSANLQNAVSVYVPQTLVSQYQSATNWSAMYAAGTVEFIGIGE